ncbi:MAG: hypothetical protein IJZ55_01635 [Lachnospiraceae bacterium]|nr:hypothetical protein [Lachnospiraceae bacterium]
MDWILAFSYAGTMWFTQLCLLLDIFFIVGKKRDYLLFMTIREEQREDEDVKQVVREFKKSFWMMMGGMFAATGVFFLIPLLPAGDLALQTIYMTLWCTALIWWDYKVIKKYANRMYDLKIEKGWGTAVKKSVAEVDTVVSRMKKSMPVSEIWLAIPVWICIGSFVWWFYCAAEYKVLLISLVFNVIAFVFFCYMYHRMAHGKLKVYSKNSELNYALNRVSKRAWTGCVVWEATLLCGFHFIATVFIHSYMSGVAAGKEHMGGFWAGFIASAVLSVVLVIAVFFGAASKVKQAKKELAAAANLSYAEDEDAYWKNGYYYNPGDTNTFVENRSLGIATNMATNWGAITKWVLIITFLACIGVGAAMLPFDFGKVTMSVGKDSLEVKGCVYYKETLDYEEAEEVYLLTDQVARESSRIMGTGTERFSLGDYRFKGYGKGKAIMDKEAEYYILVKREDGSWFGFSTTDSALMLEAYERLKMYTQKQE